MSLAGQLSVVTGGGSGIGRAAALALCAAGARVVIAGRNQQKLRDVAGQADPHGSIKYRCVDVADRASALELFDWIAEEAGVPHIVVLAAGINIPNRSMLQMDPSDWDRILATNATGVYNCLYAVLPRMRERGSGLVIHISSISGKRASDLGGIAYCASKFAATGLGTAVGLEEAPRGIRITNVYPGEVDTPILEQRPAPVSDEHRQRILKPQDVAQLLVAIATLPPHVHVPEVVIKPLQQPYA